MRMRCALLASGSFSFPLYESGFGLLPFKHSALASLPCFATQCLLRLFPHCLSLLSPYPPSLPLPFPSLSLCSSFIEKPSVDLASSEIYKLISTPFVRHYPSGSCTPHLRGPTSRWPVFEVIRKTLEMNSLLATATAQQQVQSELERLQKEAQWERTRRLRCEGDLEFWRSRCSHRSKRGSGGGWATRAPSEE